MSAIACIAKICGGGRPNLTQADGRDARKLPKAFFPQKSHLIFIPNTCLFSLLLFFEFVENTSINQVVPASYLDTTFQFLL
ncbi:hypothetical protein BZZ01_05910 [Nostocales cyanobacterium HT-58-2]|nr:hypothetical protein BZZ01_05910 [Nostocales cyanobacterium HT-58-2]